MSLGLYFEVHDVANTPTNPSITLGSLGNSGRWVCAILPDDASYTNLTYEYLGGSDVDYEAQVATEGHRLKCYDSDRATGLQVNPTDFATRNYYVLVHSDSNRTHHFAKIKEILTDDVKGDSFEFEPRLGKEIPIGTKFRVIKGELKTQKVVALAAGLKHFANPLTVARPLFYFSDELDKENELNHNTKYFISRDRGAKTSFTVADGTTVTNIRTDAVFRTIQDYGNDSSNNSGIVDYSKFSLKVSLTDKLRQIDGATLSGNITTNEGRLLSTNTERYELLFPNARRDEQDTHVNINNGNGAVRYVHYDYSPQKANYTYNVYEHENTDSIDGKGGFAETSIIDTRRIQSVKINEFDEYRVRHLVHRADLKDWFALKATYDSSTSATVFSFETEYDLSTVLNVGDEIKLGDEILLISSIGSLSGTTQEITLQSNTNPYARTESEGEFTAQAITPTSGSILYRRAYNPTDKTLMLDMHLIDSRFNKLHISFSSPNMADLFATITACDKTKGILTLSFEGDSYTGNPLERTSGNYSVFIERFFGEIEDIDIKKKEGQTIFEIKGRDKFNKLLSPIINKDTLFSEDVIYSSNSPYNKITEIRNLNYSLPLGSTSFDTGADETLLTVIPVAGDKLFTANGYIGEVSSVDDTSNYVITLTMGSFTEVNSEKVYVDNQKNYVMLKALGSPRYVSHPTTLTGSANKGVIFTSGQEIDLSDGSEDGTLVGSSNNSNRLALGYSVNSPSQMTNDRAWQARLKDEYDTNSFSTFDTVNTLMDFEIVSVGTKDNFTVLELAPYVPISLGRKLDYHFSTDEYTYTQVGTATAISLASTKGDTFVTIDSTDAYNLVSGDAIFVGSNKTFAGNVINIEILTDTSGTDRTRVNLDRDEFAFTVGDVLYTATKPITNLGFVNGKHLWGGKIVTVPHPKLTSEGAVPLNIENTNGTDEDTNEKYGQMYYKVNSMIYGNFDLNEKRINLGTGSAGNFQNFTFPELFKNASEIGYLSESYQFKPNLNSTNVVNRGQTSSSYRTFPLDQRGHTSSYGSNSTDSRIHLTDTDRLLKDFSASDGKNAFLQTDSSALRLFLYVNSDLLPHSHLRNDSLSGKTLTNYNLFLIENKGTKATGGNTDSLPAEVADGYRLGLTDSNFQTISFRETTDVGALKQFGLMRLTELTFDAFFNPVNPEKKVGKLEREYKGNSPVDFVFASNVKKAISSLPSGQITFSSSQTLANNDFIYDANNGMFIGQITSSGGGTGTTFDLIQDGHLTNDGSVPTHAYIVTKPSATIQGRAKQDTFDNTDDLAFHPLKCVVFPDYSTYDSLSINSDTELVLPISYLTSQYTGVSTGQNEILTLSNLRSGGGLSGMIGVSLDRYDVEDGGAFELEEGDTTQVLKAHNTLVAGSKTFLTMTSEYHFKEKQNVDDNGSAVTSTPFPVDGSYMVFKPRLWTGTFASGDESTVIKSSNGDVYRTHIDVTKSTFDNNFLEFIDITGCYLVTEKGTKLDDTAISTGTIHQSNRMVDVVPEEIIYVLSHEVKSSDSDFHTLITDAELDANKAYRIMQPNETCMYEFFPNELYLNTLRPQYTKKANVDDVYNFKKSYFYQEGTESDGENTIENEGVLSMFVAIDLDNSSTDGNVVIKDRRKFFNNQLPVGKYSMYFSDGDNSKKITVNASQNYSITLSEGYHGKGVVSVSEPFTLTSNEELRINPDRAVIGTTVSMGLEAEDLVNDLFEQNDIDFTLSGRDYPYYLAPNFKGIDLYSAVKGILDRKDLTLIEENGVFKVTADDDSSHYSDIIINDTNGYDIFEFEKSSTLFDFHNDIIVYGRSHRANRKDLRSIQKRGRKTLEFVDDNLLTQDEVDEKALQLLLIHSQFNSKMKITVSPKGLNQLRAGDIINVEIKRENIPLSRFIVLQVTHNLYGLMELEIGRYNKDLSDLFSEILLSNKKTNASLRSSTFNNRSESYNFLETIKPKEIRLLVRKRATTGTFKLGFSTTLNNGSKTLGFGGGTVTTTTLIDEDLL